MSLSPQLQPAPQRPSPHPVARSPSSNISPNSPTHTANAQLANLLSENFLETDALRRELAAAKKRADRAERLLATYTQPASSSAGPVVTLQVPESTIREYESRIERAESARDDADARRRVITETWSQLDRYLQSIEFHAADARLGFSRVIEGTGHPVPIPPQSVVSFSQQNASHQQLSMPPPSHSSRHHLPPSRSSSMRAPAAVPHPATPFSNISLPPPPNPNIHPQNRVRPRPNSPDDPTGVPGQPPTKRSRPDRSREHDPDRRTREERAMFTESPIDSPGIQLAHLHRPIPSSDHLPPISAHTTHPSTQSHLKSDHREDPHQHQHDQRHLGQDPHLGSTAYHERRHHRRGRRHSRSGSNGSHSRSRSSASSLSIDEMLLQATTGADDPDRRGNGNGSLNGVSTPPPGALRQHSHHRQRLPPQPELGYPHAYQNSRLRPDSPSSDYHRYHSTARSSRTHPSHSQSQPNLMTGPGMNPEGTAGPLPQPGQLQTYQTHVFAPVVTGAPVKKSKFVGSGGSLGGMSPAPPGGVPVGPGVGGSTPNVVPVTTDAVPPPPTSFPPTNAQGQRICRQCGLPGRYKDGKCVEKWGPGPHGPGTVCDRCRKKMKRVERRGTLEPHQQLQQQASAHSMPSVASPLPVRQSSTHSRSAQMPSSQGSDRSVHRTDTLIVSSTGVPIAGGPIGPGGSHVVPSSPAPLVAQHGRSSPVTRPKVAPPSPPTITTLNDNDTDMVDKDGAARLMGPGSRAQSRSSSRNDRRASQRLGPTPPVPEVSNNATDAPPVVIPSKRSPLSSESHSPSLGSKSKQDSPKVAAAIDGDVDVDADVDAEAEPDLDVGPEVEGEADAEADAEAELMEAVDAAEANSSGGTGGVWSKKEDS